MFGPFKVNGKNLSYIGNKLFKSISEIRSIEPNNIEKRFFEIKSDPKWTHIINIYDSIHFATVEFMKKRGAKCFDLPITTRMISSPGALAKTIISDVEPFEFNFFDKKLFLTQSSQLYLEFAIMSNSIHEVYCWDKSFRREEADFRHLPEFTHVEFESRINFEENLEVQVQYLKHLIQNLIKNNLDDLIFFLTDEDVKELEIFINNKFDRLSFEEAFDLLYKKTNNPKYKEVSIRNFGAYEEALLTQIQGNMPVFVTNFIETEVAFYHARDEKNTRLVKNADLLFPGYGELIGSGERIRTREELEEKARFFKLNFEDYEPYIKSRGDRLIAHSGWGMGIERFIQCILKLPFIWEAKVFPRIHNSTKP